MSAALAQFATLRSQHAEALLVYLSWVAGALESAEKLPAYMGGRSLAELYIDPDVLKIERVPVTDRGEEVSRDREAGERRDDDVSAQHREQPGKISPAPASSTSTNTGTTDVFVGQGVCASQSLHCVD